MKKKLLFGLAATLVVTLAAVFTVNSTQSDLLSQNVKAFTADDWKQGFSRGTTTINGRTIACCVEATKDDACNYGNLNCIKVDFTVE